MGGSFVDDIVRKMKKLCGDDETCVLVALVVAAFLLCYLFQREGMTSMLESGPIMKNNGSNMGNKNKGSNMGNNNKMSAPNSNPTVGLVPSSNRSSPPASMKPQMNSLGNVAKPNFGNVQSGNIQEVPVGVPTHYLGAPIDLVFKGASPLPTNQSGPLGSSNKMNANKMKMNSGNRIANGNGTNSFGRQNGQNGASYNLSFYYAPWCGHCKKMMPEFEKFNKEFGNGNSKINGRNVVVNKFSSEEHRDKMKKEGINSFPSFTLNGTKLNVSNRTKDGIVDAIKNA